MTYIYLLPGDTVRHHITPTSITLMMGLSKRRNCIFQQARWVATPGRGLRVDNILSWEWSSIGCSSDGQRSRSWSENWNLPWIYHLKLGRQIFYCSIRSSATDLGNPMKQGRTNQAQSSLVQYEGALVQVTQDVTSDKTVHSWKEMYVLPSISQPPAYKESDNCVLYKCYIIDYSLK